MAKWILAVVVLLVLGVAIVMFFPRTDVTDKTAVGLPTVTGTTDTKVELPEVPADAADQALDEAGKVKIE